MHRGLKALSVTATAIMYIVLLMGALVTNSGSADGCGDSWPLCHGTFMPDWDYHAIIEFSHRAVSGLAGLVVLGLAVWAWQAIPRRTVRWLSAISFGTLVFQGLLGAAAVVWPQPKAVLALHFGISLVCFSAVLLLTVLIFRGDVSAAESRPVGGLLQRFVWWVTIYSYGVVYLGAYVRHTRSSLACVGWPLCNGQIIPDLTGPTGANFIHRVAAALLVVLVIRLALLARHHAATQPAVVRAANLALVLVLVQVLSGALFPLGYFNLLTQMLHTAIVTVFWGALSYLSLSVAPDLERPARQKAISGNPMVTP